MHPNETFSALYSRQGWKWCILIYSMKQSFGQSCWQITQLGTLHQFSSPWIIKFCPSKTIIWWIIVIYYDFCGWFCQIMRKRKWMIFQYFAILYNYNDIHKFTHRIYYSSYLKYVHCCIYPKYHAKLFHLIGILILFMQVINK